MKMTGSERWLLPSGIDELLPPDAIRLEELRQGLVAELSRWGYQFVIPPFLEFLESMRGVTGDDLDVQTLKVTDHETGRLMSLRADMTPQIARVDAHHLAHIESPVRLCYAGTVLHARTNKVHGTRSPLQAGGELYGHAGPESDVEVIMLMLAVLRRAGVEGVRVSLGHAGVFRGLVALANLAGESELSVYEALQRKSPSELKAALEAAAIPDDLSQAFMLLVELHGDRQVLDVAQSELGALSPAVAEAIASLKTLSELLEIFGCDASLHFDLAELPGYRYHSGVVFAAFVNGYGGEVARGGRYDGFGSAFGRGRPATGFSTDLKTLQTLTAERRSDDAADLIVAPWKGDKLLLAKIAELRASGETVVYDLPGSSSDTFANATLDVSGRRKNERPRRLVQSETGTWQVAG